MIPMAGFSAGDKRGMPGRRRLQSSDSASVDGTISGTGGSSSSSGAVGGEELGAAAAGMEWYSNDTTGGSSSTASTAVSAAIVAPRINPAVPGPAHVCNPTWPNFMTDLKTREKVACSSSINNSLLILFCSVLTYHLCALSDCGLFQTFIFCLYFP